MCVLTSLLLLLTVMLQDFLQTFVLIPVLLKSNCSSFSGPPPPNHRLDTIYTKYSVTFTLLKASTVIPVFPQKCVAMISHFLSVILLRWCIIKITVMSNPCLRLCSIICILICISWKHYSKLFTQFYFDANF